MSGADALQRWLGRLGRAADVHPSLDEALLTDRPWRYATYRIRYALPRAALRTVLHVVEVFAVTSIFRFEYVAPLLAIRGAVAIAGSAFWGALESLRTRVRNDAAQRRWHHARICIEAWLSYSIDFALLTLAALIAWVKFGPRLVEGFSVFDTFAIACALRLILESLARTYHAGVGALRRVYRPLPSVLVPDVLEVAAVLALLPVLGLWSLSIVTLGIGVVRAALLYHYTRHAYVSARMPLPRWRALGRARKELPLRAELGMLPHAAANLAARVDSFLVVALLYASPGSGKLFLAVTFHLLQPVLALGQRWAGLFYLDFLILRARHLPFLQRRFQVLLQRFAIAFPLAITAVVAPVVVLLLPGFPPLLLGLLGIFLVQRSMLGLYQVQAFSYHQHRYLAKLTGAVLVTIAIATIGFGEAAASMAALLVLLGLTLALLRPPPLVQEQSLAGCPRLPLLSWLAALKKNSEAGVWIGAATVNARAGVPRSRVARCLSSVIESGALTVLGRKHLLWFGTGAPPAGIRRDLVLASGGCLSKLEVQRATSAALAVPQAVSLLADIDPALLRVAPLRSAQALCDLFRAQFPQGRVIEASRGALREASRATLRAIVRELSGRQSRAASATPDDLDVAIYAPDGVPELVFAMQRSAPARARSEFRALVQRESLARTAHQ